MATRKYDFNSGVETASSPTVAAPTAVGDVIALGATTTFTLADSSAAASITGLLFDKTVHRGFMLTGTIYRSAAGGSTRASFVVIKGVTDGSGWEISVDEVSNPSSDDSGIDFTITSAGQLKYASDANGGSYSAAASIFKYELLQLIAV